MLKNLSNIDLSSVTPQVGLSMPTQLRSGDQAPYATWACIIKCFFKFFYLLFVIE